MNQWITTNNSNKKKPNKGNKHTTNNSNKKKPNKGNKQKNNKKAPIRAKVEQPRKAIIRNENVTYRSYGQTLLKDYLAILFPKQTIYENATPNFLKPLEVDFLIPAKKVAIEFNGDQHYYPNGLGSFEKQKKRDWYKKQKLLANDYSLVIVEACDLDHKILLKMFSSFHNEWNLSSLVKKNLKYFVRETSILDDKSIGYRSLLLEKYNSPTVFPRESEKRKTQERKVFNL